MRRRKEGSLSIVQETRKKYGNAKLARQLNAIARGETTGIAAELLAKQALEAEEAAKQVMEEEEEEQEPPMGEEETAGVDPIHDPEDDEGPAVGEDESEMGPDDAPDDSNDGQDQGGINLKHITKGPLASEEWSGF